MWLDQFINKMFTLARGDLKASAVPEINIPTCLITGKSRELNPYNHRVKYNARFSSTENVPTYP